MVFDAGVRVDFWVEGVGVDAPLDAGALGDAGGLGAVVVVVMVAHVFTFSTVDTFSEILIVRSGSQ